MPIQRLATRRRLPIIGKIRLGERKEAKSGTEYPVNVPYFVLDDAPGVADVYGPNPTELDIMFPSNDIESVIPTWFRWFSAGQKDASGKVIGGKRICQGNGEIDKDTPGEATWFDRNRKPPEDEIISVDVASGQIKRKCYGKFCVDARDEKGNPKCKQGMQVFCILPRVGFYGVYEIDTTSWDTITAFDSALNWWLSLPGGSFRWQPFKIKKVEKVKTFYDARAQQEKTSKQQIMTLEFNPQFEQIHGDDMRLKLGQLRNSEQVMLPPAEELDELGMEDHYPVLDAAAQAHPAESPVTVENLVDDPDLTLAFDEYGKLLGKEFTAKDKAMLIKKKEGAPDLKEVVWKTLLKHIAERKAFLATQLRPPPPMEVHEDADGIT